VFKAYALGEVSYHSGYPLLISGLQDKYKPTTLSNYEVADFTSSFGGNTELKTKE